MKTSQTLLSNAATIVTGTPYQVANLYGTYNYNFTLAIFTSNFAGNLYIEASLVQNPGAGDWFIVENFTFPRQPPQMGYMGETSKFSVNFVANLTWIRARTDQVVCGLVDRILLNN